MMKVWIVFNETIRFCHDLTPIHVFDSEEKLYNFVSPYYDKEYPTEEERQGRIDFSPCSTWEEVKHWYLSDGYVDTDEANGKYLTWVSTEVE